MINCPRCKTANNPVNTRCYRCNALLQPNTPSTTSSATPVPPPLPPATSAPLFPSSAAPSAPPAARMATPPPRPAKPVRPAQSSAPPKGRHSSKRPRTLGQRVPPPNDPSMRDMDIPTPPSPEWSSRDVPFTFNPADMPTSDDDIFTSAQSVETPPSSPNLSKSTDSQETPSHTSARTSSPRIFVRNPSAPNIPSPVSPSKPASPAKQTPSTPSQPPPAPSTTPALHNEEDEEPTLVGPAPKAPSATRSSPPSALGLLKRSARRMNFAPTSSNAVAAAPNTAATSPKDLIPEQTTPSNPPPSSTKQPEKTRSTDPIEDAPTNPKAKSPTPPKNSLLTSPPEPNTAPLSPKPPTPDTAPHTHVTLRLLGTKQVFTLQHNRLIIGREDGDVLLTKDLHVSPWHALISHDSHGTFLKDMASHNGVYIQLQKPHTLQDDDRFRVGQQVVTFSSSWTSPATAPCATHETPQHTSPPPAYRARLSAHHPNGALSLLFPLPSDKPTSLGSSQATLLFPDDPTLQPTHARIQPEVSADGPVFVLQQAHSDSSIFIQIHGEIELKDQDTILLGSTELRVEISSNDPAQ